jgi:hypothetical protein
MASIFTTLAFHWAGRNNRFPDQLNGSITPHGVQKSYKRGCQVKNTSPLPERQKYFPVSSPLAILPTLFL